MVKKVQSWTAVHQRPSKQQKLKLGLILECTIAGPDKMVCEYLVKRLRPGCEVISITLDNKLKLIAECGSNAAQLLRENCQSVVIVWDLYPPWRKGKPCRRTDREGIFLSLEQAGVASQNVHLVCIREELEAWLLADNRAIASAIKKLTGRNSRIVEISKKPESISDPKTRLDNIFREHTHRAYQAHNNALQIIRELPNFKRIARCPSFARFALKAAGIEI